MPGARYCDLLLSLGRCDEVIGRARDALKQEAETGRLVPIARNRLCLAEALARKGRHAEAREAMDRAVQDTQAAGFLQNLSYAHAARADHLLRLGDLEQADADLKRAFAVAQRCQSELDRADCHLVRGRLHLARHDRGDAGAALRKAVEDLETAGAIIRETGYGLRHGDVRRLWDEIERRSSAR